MSRTVPAEEQRPVRPTFEPVRALRPFEEAAVQIVDAIRTGTLAIGERLPSERVLASQMEISRPTVREAIRLLVDAGVLEVRRGARGGAFVTSQDVPAPAELRAVDSAKVLEVRRILEPAIAQLAAVRAGPEDFAELRETIGLLRESGDDPHRWFHLNTRFHLAMARSTGNELLVDLIDGLFRKLEVILEAMVADAGEPETTIAMHERTLAALEDGDPAAIAAVMDEHLDSVESIGSSRPALRPRAGRA